MARACDSARWTGSEIQQLRRHPASDSTPADRPHSAPAIDGRVGNARAAISVAITMNGAPISVGQTTHSHQSVNSSPGGTTVALAAFVTSVIALTSTTVIRAATASDEAETL